MARANSSNTAAAFEDDIAFGGGVQGMPARGDPGFDAGAGDGAVRIAGRVREFEDVALLGRVELRNGKVGFDVGFHEAGSYVPRGAQHNTLCQFQS